MVRVTGRLVLPVSAVAVILLPTPTLIVDNTIKLAPLGPGMLTAGTPSSVWQVPESATMSGIGVLEAENKKVLTPGKTGAGSLFVQSKFRTTSVGAVGLLGVNVMRKHPAPFARISIGVLGELTGRLVAQLVVWKEKVAGRLVTGEIPQPSAVAVP
jgi:hypothetical protein